MASGNDSDKRMKAYCSNCRGERNCDIVGHHQKQGEDGGGNYQWYKDWYLLVCRGCEHAFAQTVFTDSESFHQEYDAQGEVFTLHDEIIHTWPARSKRDRPDWYSHDGIESHLPELGPLNASLSELYGALDQDLNVLASIGMRTSFDIAAEILGVDPSKSFKLKLDELVAKGLIKESEKEHIEILVDAGSASAHRGWKPRAQDLDALMDTLEGFIYDTMVLPAKQKEKAEKIAKVKLKVPAKQNAVKQPAGQKDKPAT
ncbi:DUF4145 domain-containing protein [Sinorhizobium medicae]|nr:DUF4145 domain-containing protein [Sinorhizobium medicae]